MRSTLHDMANILAGVQGIVELSAQDRPLSQRDRDRLEAVVGEGLATLSRARHLAMGTLPDPLVEEGSDWRAQLADELTPLGILFKCRFDIIYEGGPGPDVWGAHLRGYLRAAARHVLPYVHGGTLAIHCASGAEAWSIHLRPITILPEALLALPEDKPGDICCRWAHHLGNHLGLTLSCEDGALMLRIPRT